VDYICGGYFLTKSDCPVLTLSPEHATFFPDSWAISWCSGDEGARLRSAAVLGIPSSALPRLVPRVTAAFDELFFWPNVIPSVDAARALLQFLPASKGWTLLAFGVSGEDAATLMARNAPPPPQPGYAPVGSTGIYATLQKGKPLEPGGVELGFDTLEIGFGLLWHTSLDFDLGATDLAGTTIAHGLLPDYASAARAAHALTSRLAPNNPGTVTAAQIVRYDLG
jgi:hypothetical protein